MLSQLRLIWFDFAPCIYTEVWSLVEEVFGLILVCSLETWHVTVLLECLPCYCLAAITNSQYMGRLPFEVRYKIAVHLVTQACVKESYRELFEFRNICIMYCLPPKLYLYSQRWSELILKDNGHNCYIYSCLSLSGVFLLGRDILNIFIS